MDNRRVETCTWAVGKPEVREAKADKLRVSHVYGIAVLKIIAGGINGHRAMLSFPEGYNNF
jgi:hypothetical protein